MSSNPNISVNGKPEFTEEELRQKAAAFDQRFGNSAAELLSETQRQDFRADFERRQEWNGLIEGGSVTGSGQQRSVQDLKAPAEMTKAEIVTEARELHAHFSEMASRFEQMELGPERTQLREEMKPLVTRENELREEYTGRIKAEVSREIGQDHVPEQSFAYGR